MTRLALRDLALLRLQYPSLDTAVEAGRRRMKQGSALYLSSVGSTDHLFWVGAPAEVREGPSLGVYRSGEFSKALAALLCALTLPGPFTIHSRYRRALERAVRESGCAVVGRLDAASPASGHPPIASGADSDVALRAAS